MIKSKNVLQGILFGALSFIAVPSYPLITTEIFTMIKYKNILRGILFGVLSFVTVSRYARIPTVANVTELRTTIENSTDGDTIDISSGIYAFSSPIVIDKSLVLNGVGATLVALDGANKTRIFHFTGNNSKTLELNNIQFQNGRSNDSGGGAAILIDSGTVIINKITFKNNHATGSGGAINNSGIAQIYRSTFFENTAISDGNAIANNSGATLIVDHSTIINNNSTKAAIDNAGTATFSATILSNDKNCSSTSGTYISKGYNWQTLYTCSSFTKLTDLFNQASHGLQATLTNSGTTEVYKAISTSNILDKAGTKSDTCKGTDPLGTSLPVNTRCDIGAIEYKLATTSGSGTNDDDHNGRDDDDDDDGRNGSDDDDDDHNGRDDDDDDRNGSDDDDDGNDKNKFIGSTNPVFLLLLLLLNRITSKTSIRSKQH
jgi:predicted outer membrane repeat protein